MNKVLVLALLLKVYPDMIFIEERSAVVFAAHLQNSATRNPTQVRLMRLEGSGNAREACVMKETSAKPATPENRIFACTLSLKEKTPGLLSYHVEAEYIDEAVPLRSKPAFVTIVGGVTPKERKEMLKIQSQGQSLYVKLAQQKGLIQARKETTAWVMKQQGVLGLRTLPNHDISVQFTSGSTVWLRAPEETQR